MKATAAFIFAGALLCTASLGWAQSVAGPTITNHEAPGNLESRHDLGCLESTDLSNRYTPAELYRAVAACAKQGKYKDASVLLALAGVYGRFDVQRVSDKTSHQALTILKMQALGNLTKEQQRAFKDDMRVTLGDPANLAVACQLFERIGPPHYHPVYMIQHGMSAFTKTDASNGLVKDFNAQVAWQQSLDSYLHCPG